MSIRTYVLADLDADERVEILKRPRVDFTNILGTVAPIVDAVASRGDEAVLEYTSKFDKVDLDKCVVRVADLPDPKLDDDVKAAFDMAYDNIHKFHAAQKELADVDVETMPGVRCRRVSRPIGAVGLYVPGGTAVLPSTALMLAVPAKIAGCETVVLATPPDQGWLRRARGAVRRQEGGRDAHPPGGRRAGGGGDGLRHPDLPQGGQDLRSR